jgi:hypothetical protein
MKLRNVLLSLVGIVPMCAETPAVVSGPLLGYVSNNGVLRPLMGIVGAAWFGPASARNIAVVCSDAGYAVRLLSGQAYIERLDNGESVVLQQQGVDAAICSPTGTALALIRGAEVDVITGLPTNPELKRTVTLMSPAKALAVSDDGSALATFSEGSLELIEANARNQVATLGELRDLAFRPGTHDLLYADESSLMLASGRAVRILGGVGDGITSPRKTLFSRDGSQVFVIESGPEAFLEPDNGGRGFARIALACVPGTAEWMRGSTLRVSCGDQDRTFVVDVSAKEARVFFVPAVVE